MMWNRIFDKAFELELTFFFLFSTLNLQDHLLNVQKKDILLIHKIAQNSIVAFKRNRQN